MTLPSSLILAPWLAAIATVTAAPSTVQLDTLDLTHVTSGWKTAKRALSVGDLPMTLAGRTFTHGIGVHAPSAMKIALDGKAQTLTAVVGVNDTGGNEVGTVEFRVIGDSRQLWSSGPLRKGGPPKPVSVNLDGVRRLTLEVDPLGTTDSDHANWADAAISYTGAAPVAFDPAAVSTTLYPAPEKLTASPGNATYYINPAAGDDTRAGTAAATAWKSIAKVNAMKLAPGDQVFIAPGHHGASLKPSGAGTAEKPIIIRFMPGIHAFGSVDAFRRPYFVSNSADDPKHPLPIGIMVENTKHIRIDGGGEATVILDGPERMTYFINDHAEDISFAGLTFDLKRPTVSEFRVLEKSDNSVVIQIEEASTYEIKDGKFAWTGDVGNQGLMVQQANPAEGRCWRMGGWDPFSSAKAEDLGHSKVRLTYAKGTNGMELGRQFHFRATKRDVVTAHITRCKNISFRDCDFHAMTGMAILSQFTDGITFERVRVAPKKGTIRTCPAWADMFHFSGCRGQILVNECVFSGAQDDPINVHGTHLRIIGKPADNQLMLRFMHPQTYGFPAFMPGDEVAVIGHANLRETAGNPRRKVTAIAPNPADATGREWLLTLDGPAPAYAANDVIDNISWYPDVTIKNCKVDMDATRGFLLTTRGKVLVEGCTFHRCTMAAILIENDAEGWFESGPINDMTLRNNRFIGCGIEINPASRSQNPDEPVHQNIRILDNFFDGAGISAHHVKGLTITGNRSTSGKIPLNLAPTCTQVEAKDNERKHDQP